MWRLFALNEINHAAHPCSRLHCATQRPLRSKCRHDTHIVGPGPQQPSSEHSGSQVWFCCSVWSRWKQLLFSDGRSTQLQKELNSGLTAGVASRFADLVFGFEELGPVHGLRVAQVWVVLQRHVPSTHLLQWAQAKPAQVLHLHHHQTVLTERRTGHL